jgi:transcriptional regulator with GAF, ATPase, and Fis domain
LDALEILPASAPMSGDRGHSELNLREATTRLEKDLIVEAQKRTGGVRRDAARLLGIDPRNFAYYSRKHGLDEADEDESAGRS